MSIDAELITERKTAVRRHKLDKLTLKQKLLINEMASSKDMCVAKAAKAVGYSENGARKALTSPVVKAALGKILYDRLERVRLTQDDVLKYLDGVLFFNPLHYFYPGEDGTWCIDDPSELPEEVGIMIESMKVFNKINGDTGEREQSFEIKFVSKTQALALAMKHVSIGASKVQKDIEWDKMYIDDDMSDEQKEELDEIEKFIEDVANEELG